jgi:MFS family permease
MLVAGVAGVALASLLCATAPSLAWLQAARGVQGIGAALLMPNSLAILGNVFSGEARGRAIGIWASAGAIAAAIGPPLGGWLVDTVGWRAISAVDLPVSLAAIFVALRFVEESAEGEQPLDWWGATLATLTLGALTWSLTLWSSHHVASMPVLVGTSGGLTLLTVLLYGVLGGMFLVLPYLLMVGGGYTPLQAGLSLLPFSIVTGTMSRLAGRLTARIGPRWPLTIGPIVTSVGFALMMRLDRGAGYWIAWHPAWSWSPSEWRAPWRR